METYLENDSMTDISLDFVDKLREVFNACDNENLGYISVKHFIDLAKTFTLDGDIEPQSLNRIINCLDSNGNGEINFNDFCNGVYKITQLNGFSPNISKGEALNNNLFRDANLKSVETNLFNEEQLINFDINNFNNEHHLKVSTNNKLLEEREKITKHDIQTQDKILNLESHLLLNKNSDISNTITVKNHDTLIPSVSDNVTHYISESTNGSEDDIDSGAWSANCTSNNIQCFGIDEQNMSYSNTPPHSFNHSGLSAPNSRAGSFRKTVTPSSIASHLYRLGNSYNFETPSQNISGEQDLFENNHLLDLNKKIVNLESKLEELSENHKNNEDKNSKIKEENNFFIERILTLEEQLKDIESQTEEKYAAEIKRHKNQLIKTEKDKSYQIDVLTQSLQLIEQEYKLLKTELPILKNENELNKKLNAQLERELAKLQEENIDLLDEKNRIQEILHKEQLAIQKERKSHNELIDELSQELNELRICKMDLIRLSPANSEKSSKNEIDRLQNEINRLKKENTNLRFQLEEMQAELLSKHVEEGINLSKQQTSSLSLSHELENVPKLKLIEALQQEKESNKKLQDYIDQTILKILEKDPSILEVAIKNNK